MLRKQRQEQNIPSSPKYFSYITDAKTGEQYYKMTRDYWKDREEQNWSHLDDLYGYDNNENIQEHQEEDNDVVENE